MKEISELNLVEIGVITKTHSYKGNLVIHLNIDFDKIYETEHVFVNIDGIHVPFFIENNNFKSYKKNLSIIKLKDINSDLEAEKYIGKKILLSQEDIIESDESPIKNIMNFEVYNGNEYIGKINSYIEIPSNPLVSILLNNNKEVLVPFNDEFIIETNIKEQKIIFNLPEGLLDIND